jgi:PilZ domain
MRQRQSKNEDGKDLRVGGFLSIYIVERTRLGKERGAAMGIDHDQGKRNTVERRRVPRAYVRFQVTAINGKPAPNVFILDISPLGAKVESPPLSIPAMSLELKFLVPGEGRETRAIGEVVWLEGSKPLGLNLMGISFLKPYGEFFRFVPYRRFPTDD